MKLSFFAWQDVAISIALVHSNACFGSIRKIIRTAVYNLEWQGQLNGSRLVYIQWNGRFSFIYVTRCCSIENTEIDCVFHVQGQFYT